MVKTFTRRILIVIFVICLCRLFDRHIQGVSKPLEDELQVILCQWQHVLEMSDSNPGVLSAGIAHCEQIHTPAETSYSR
jgi:hypothetical protein